MYPENIGSFLLSDGKEFFFTSCEGCGGKCCTGKNNFVLAPLVLEDLSLVYENFPIVFRMEEGRVKFSILLNDGESGCWYLENEHCTIYENRPPTCKQYPMSPYYEKLYVDMDCPAVSLEDGKPMIKNEISKEFFVKRFENFREKLEKTDEFLSSLDLNGFQKIATIAGVDLFVYQGESSSKYIDFHKRSIINCENLLLSAFNKGKTK